MIIGFKVMKNNNINNKNANNLSTDDLNKNHVYCYKCYKKLIPDKDNYLYCKEHSSINNSILIYSEKYKRWLTTRNKYLKQYKSAAETAYENRINKRQNIILNRINYINELNKKFDQNFIYEDYETNSYGYIFNIKCSLCNNIFSLRYDHFIENIEKSLNENNNSLNIICSKCFHDKGNKLAAQIKSGPGICSICGKYTIKRDSACRCSDCIGKISRKDRENNQKAGLCKYCGKWNNIRNNVGLGKECGCSDKMYKERGMNTKFCEICNKYTLHNEGKCLTCFPNAKPGTAISFITKNNVRFYKGIEVNEFAWKILNNELNIKDYHNINIRFGRVCYGTEDIITSEKLLKVSKFEIKDNVPYFYDKSVNDYIPWEDYKKKFIIQSKYVDIKNILPEFKLYSTFRTQDSNSWSGGSKQAFEQSLVDDSILWFVYIKFYLDTQNNSKPLVCGKSGSLLVNSNGSDLSFSTDINDGPARRFLAENQLQWDKTKVAILSCSSEKEAYELERKYLEKLNLFGS